MTTLALPARLEQDARLRPVPWRRMGWVIWRHHRVALAGVVAFLGALAVWLWITGLSVHHEYAAAVACRPVGSANCTNLAAIFDGTNSFLKGGFVLQPVAALIGAFVGSVVLAREFETGTFRYAWTQAFGRCRWAVAKLVALGVAVAALAGAFGVLLSWYYQPYVAAQNAPNVSGASLLSAGLFDLRPGRVRRVDARRLRDRRPRRHARPPDRAHDRRHPRRLYRTRSPDGECPAPALHDAARGEKSEHTWLGLGHQ